MNNPLDSKRKMIVLYIFSYIGFSLVMSNLTPFLKYIGYNTMERGILLSTYALTTICFQIVFGIFADRYQTLKKIVIFAVGVFALVSSLLFLQEVVFFWLHLLLVALSIGLLNTCCGLFDTWVLNSGKVLQSKLSFIKAFGSIGWALGSLVSSYVITMFSYRSIAILLVVIFALVLINVHMIDDIEKVPQQQKTSFGDIVKLFQDKRYMLLVFILFLMYSVVVANNTTVIDKMLELNASTMQISLKWSMQSLLEIPTYLLGIRILRRYQHFFLLQLSCAVLAIQFILFSFTQSVTIMILLSTLQMFSTPLILITSKMLIFDMSADNVKNSSQLLALSIFTGLSSLLIPALAGISSLYIGVDATLFIASLFAIGAFLLIPKLKRMKS